ncbi:DUF1289 domain-containing protein [Burkholderia gladioli]|uniref:DUF1289 domain-containing protein n=1 Tax=Burkholderia gladioli TaxID=28095 RepID=UPI00164098BA|nr:DUF1289 domain-containing protein [Burkholderia gladioli]MBU9194597.1 DUF1289 domain-containing protein [Burkholderia gladioli]
MSLPAGATGTAAAGVASPCTAICRIEPATGWCAGCGRTLEEIAAWRDLDDAGRRAILARIAASGFEGPPAEAQG